MYLSPRNSLGKVLKQFGKYSYRKLTKCILKRCLWFATIALICVIYWICGSGQPTVACFVLQGGSREELSKGEAIKNTWGRYCHRLEFIDHRTTGIEVTWIEGYSALSMKSFRAWEYMFQKYIDGAVSNTVDFILKADTDTYILADNLHKYLRRLDSNLPYYIGKQFVNREGTTFVAGTSIVLSKASLKLFMRASRETGHSCASSTFKSEVAEDVALARCMQSLGIYPHNTRDDEGAERFMAFNPNSLRLDSSPFPGWYMNFTFNDIQGPGCCSSEAIAFHMVSSHELLCQVPVFDEGEWWWRDLRLQFNRELRWKCRQQLRNTIA
jgi:hypothetical protein